MKLMISQSTYESFRKVKEKKLDAALKYQPESFDKNSMTATFVSHSTGEVYNVSLKSCTCVDFSIHREPCKHMVRLAMLAGIPISFIHEIKIPVEVEYGAPVPQTLDDIEVSSPEIRDYTLTEFFELLDVYNIAHEDNRKSGGCIWVENQKQFMAALSKLTVEGKKLRRKYYGSHFSWNFDWYLMTEENRKESKNS